MLASAVGFEIEPEVDSELECEAGPGVGCEVEPGLEKARGSGVLLLSQVAFGQQTASQEMVLRSKECLVDLGLHLHAVAWVASEHYDGIVAREEAGLQGS